MPRLSDATKGVILKDCTKEELLWYLTEKMCVNQRSVLIEIVYRRWSAQEALCEKLRKQSLDELKNFSALYKCKSPDGMTDREYENVLAAARKSDAADAAVRAAEKKSALLYKQLNALYEID